MENNRIQKQMNGSVISLVYSDECKTKLMRDDGLVDVIKDENKIYLSDIPKDSIIQFVMIDPMVYLIEYVPKQVKDNLQMYTFKEEDTIILGYSKDKLDYDGTVLCVMHRNEYNQDLDLITTFTGDQADKLIEVLTTPVGLGEELDLGGITDDDSEN